MSLKSSITQFLSMYVLRKNATKQHFRVQLTFLFWSLTRKVNLVGLPEQLLIDVFVRMGVAC